jgi:hypothetical protein
MIKNQNGAVVIVAVMMVLSILTIIGVASNMVSNTELKISVAESVHIANLFAAESGEPVAAERLLDPSFLPESDYGNPDWVGTGSMDLTNTSFSYVVTPMKNEDGEVLRYGDEDGDHLWEVNTTTGYPLETVVTDGTHKHRGGLYRIEVGLKFKPIFEPPGAPLWVDDPDKVNFQGNASVIGDSIDDSVCSDVPDVLHHLDPLNPMDIPKHYGDDFVHENSGGMYPFGPVKEQLLQKADYIGDTFPSDIAEASSLDKPVIIVLEGEIHFNDDDLKTPGYGILYIDGDLFINGNIEWNGLIITTGSASIGNGTADINGSLVTGEAADVDISGTIVLQYRCDILKKIYDNYSRYERLWWRHIT